MMNVMQACAPVAKLRGDALVVATMLSMFILDHLKVSEGRISSVPLMGGAAGLGLGLALAQPARKVVVLDGDASLLMELGGLVTVAAAAPQNLLHVVIHNGTQFTGLANMQVHAPTLNFAGLAREAGYRHVERIEDASAWAERFAALLAMPGPVFVELMVEPTAAQTKPGFEQQEMPDRQFERMGQEVAAMRAMLGRGA